MNNGLFIAYLNFIVIYLYVTRELNNSYPLEWIVFLVSSLLVSSPSPHHQPCTICLSQSYKGYSYLYRLYWRSQCVQEEPPESSEGAWWRPSFGNELTGSHLQLQISTKINHLLQYLGKRHIMTCWHIITILLRFVTHQCTDMTLLSM